MFEKEAEEYEDNAEYIEIDNHGHKVYGWYEIEQAYQKGAEFGYNKGLAKKANEWHYVKDGDLPKHCRYGSRTSEYVLAKFKSGNTGVCYFDFYLLGWFADGYPEQFKNIIAWCEIPKFKEEVE